MKGRFLHQIVLGILLIYQFSTCLTAKAPEPNESSKYLNAVREFADNGLKISDIDARQYVFHDVNQLPSHEGLPDLFLIPDGSRVSTEVDWDEYRVYLKEMLAHYQYGHMPPKPERIKVQNRTSQMLYGTNAIWTRLDLVISHKDKEVTVRTGMLVPNKVGKFPVIIKNDRFLFNASEIEDPAIRRVYEGRREQIEEFVRHEAIKRGYVLCKFIRTDLALDEEDNRGVGVFDLYPTYDWGTIAAWAWGYKIVIDALGQESFVDMEKIVATGHARGGKAALCAGIYEESIVITAPNVSGPGGTGSWRFFDPNQYPRGLAAVKEGVSYFWTPRLFSFIGYEHKMPFDSHFVKALIAPRVLLNTAARHDYSTNPYGNYLTRLAAQSVFDMLKVEQNCLIHWRDGRDHNQSEEDWLSLFDLCDKVFFERDIKRRFNNNPFPGLYRFDFLLDVNKVGITALHNAVEKGHKVTEILIASGVDVNVKDKSGETPIHYAVRAGHKDTAELLLAKSVDINASNNEGQTPLDIAVMERHKDIAQLLVDKGAKTSSTWLTLRLNVLLAQKEETNKDRSGEKPAKEEKKMEDAPDDPNSAQFSDMTAAPNKPYVVLERSDVRAVIVNNEPVNDEVLPGHRSGYSGVASLTHRARKENLFVPFYAGLNFEHIHDGTVKPRDILFEPRRAPMEIRRVDEYTAELYQPPTPHWQLESWLRYKLLDDGAIEMTLECIPRDRTFKNDYIGLFFASYIDKPESLDIHFLGCPADQIDAEPQWIRGVTPEHGTLPTHLAVDDNRNFAHDPNFPLTLVFNKSNYRYTEPWYYGVSHGMVFVLMFQPGDNVRLSQSPSGAGKGNPAWDFQWFVPQYKVGQRYRFVMRAMYLPFESRQQIIQATARHRAALTRQ
jgi:hypothetical protein